MRTLLGKWGNLDGARGGITLSGLLARFTRPTSSNISAKGTRGDEGEQDWRSDRVDCRAALQTLAKCPDRAVPDSTKLGNGLRPYVDRWFSAAGKERRFVHALSPVTKRPLSRLVGTWRNDEG